MSLTVIIIIIVAALAFILSNIITLQKSKSFTLPDSYKARKAAEAEHLAQTQPDAATKKAKGYENDYAKEDKQDNW
ncbi:MAG: DUF2897 family protein [Glaciecola sp.]|jgi:hypothetical protein|nr:DUF2897 family protein [Glaciecola sp.]MDG1814666.1 DUF2897 family protein [Glaciecola sp.]MDG2100268.1 DUF2897 family protein [Glaciecola sp.]